jgi:hypothetical protein
VGFANRRAIALPQFQVKSLDATRKKIAFLDSLIEKLELKNVTNLTGLQQIGEKLEFQIESINQFYTPLTNSIRHGVDLRKNS